MRAHPCSRAVLVLALLAASCAGPAKLARQSDEALARGDVRKAYDRALRAIEKDPQNAEARSAYTNACTRVAGNYRERVRAMAAADTLKAADLALDFRLFRADVAGHGVTLPRDAAYADEERALVESAARGHYRQGRAALAAHRPREAWLRFTDCRRYDDGYADVLQQQEKAYRQAQTRVALLPFTDEVDVRGLSQEIGENAASEVARRLDEGFRFTTLVDQAEVESKMTLAQARDFSREDAMALGRKLGADRVVVGRFSGLRSSTNTRDLTLPVYRRVEGTDGKGQKVVRWQESSMRIVTRQRDVTVRYAFEVVDVRTGLSLARRAEPLQTSACVVWTDFRPEGDCDDYALLPPDVRAAEPERVKKVEGQWRERVGNWKLVSFLQRARDDRERTRYERRYRGEFAVDTRPHPVWLGELPGEDDMAFVALAPLWRPLLATLKELDTKD